MEFHSKATNDTFRPIRSSPVLLFSISYICWSAVQEALFCRTVRDTTVPLIFEATTHGRTGGSCGVVGVMRREKTHKYA